MSRRYPSARSGRRVPMPDRLATAGPVPERPRSRSFARRCRRAARPASGPRRPRPSPAKARRAAQAMFVGEQPGDREDREGGSVRRPGRRPVRPGTRAGRHGRGQVYVSEHRSSTSATSHAASNASTSGPTPSTSPPAGRGSMQAGRRAPAGARLPRRDRGPGADRSQGAGDARSRAAAGVGLLPLFRRGPRAGRGRVGRSRIDRLARDIACWYRHAQPVRARRRDMLAESVAHRATGRPHRRGDRHRRRPSSCTSTTTTRTSPPRATTSCGARSRARPTSSSRSSRPTATTSCRRCATARSTAPRSTTLRAGRRDDRARRAGHRAVHPLQRLDAYVRSSIGAASGASTGARSPLR